MKAEYIWLDGYTPEPNLRSKTKILNPQEHYEWDFANPLALSNYPEWSFDGSSTSQAQGNFSDCILRPVKVVVDAGRDNAVLVLCEVMMPGGQPHLSNTRAAFDDVADMWFGFEQEYVFFDSNKMPVGFPANGWPAAQGLYYCSVGAGNVTCRDIVEDHLNLCLKADLNITGINAEVLLGQWEFQAFGKGAKEAADTLWLARYLLHRTAEQYSVTVNTRPKPVSGPWNGSGLHCNFSNAQMRDVGGKAYFDQIFQKLKDNHVNHIKNYGSDNDKRLTGKYETASIKVFTFGVSDRGASIRIPLATANSWQGYLEDRRPGANADPYRVAKVLCESLA